MDRIKKARLNMIEALSREHPQTLKHMKNQNSKLHFGHYELSVQFYQYYTVVVETLHQYL